MKSVKDVILEELKESHPEGLSLPELHHKMRAQKSMRVTLGMLKDALHAMSGGSRYDHDSYPPYWVDSTAHYGGGYMTESGIVDSRVERKEDIYYLTQQGLGYGCGPFVHVRMDRYTAEALRDFTGSYTGSFEMDEDDEKFLRKNCAIAINRQIIS